MGQEDEYTIEYTIQFTGDMYDHESFRETVEEMAGSVVNEEDVETE